MLENVDAADVDMKGAYRRPAKKFTSRPIRDL
jgi:hypothetical protein